MIAGLILLSAAVGLMATAAAFAFSVPAWIALASYPVVCSLTLLLAAAFVATRSTQDSQPILLHPQA